MYSISVESAHFSYPIYIGSDLFTNLDFLSHHIQGQQVMIVSDTVLAPLYLEKVVAACAAYQCDAIILPAGEHSKTLATVNQIFDALLSKGHTRTTTLLALGGGVIGDMTGFAASCYMRGVNFIQLPTTLLAQVDAAIGGKTGVNHPLGKNMIGSFYQPRAVVIDIDTLSTLPTREFRAGLAEVIKYGLICDNQFLNELEQNLVKILAKTTDALLPMIQRCCQIKADFIVADERETGKRALLNLGHSFGHAIERGLGYQSWLHGEAVAVGMLLAARLSAQRGWLSLTDIVYIERLLLQAGLPTVLPSELSATRLLEWMRNDKKNLQGHLRLILLRALGQAVIAEEVPLDEVKKVLEEGVCCE